MKHDRGNALALAVGLVLVSLLFLPLIIELLTADTKQSEKGRKSTLAFQLAEAAVTKGANKLIESRKNWTDALAGNPITNFMGDREFDDIHGGKYKVEFSSTSVPGIVRVIGKGRDHSSKEVRVIEVEYSITDPIGPAVIFNQGLGAASPNIQVHWGAVKSYGDLNYLKEYSYPRLYSSGFTRRDNSPAQPNTNNVDNWSYQTNFGSPPQPDLPYYKQKAMNSVVPSSSTNGTGEIRLNTGGPVPRNPANSGYFDSNLFPLGSHVHVDKLTTLPEGMGNYYEFRNSTSVVYVQLGINGWFRIFRAHLELEALIIQNGGNMDFGGSTTTYMVFGATIPDIAPTHYQGTTVWMAGYPTGQTVWANNFAAPYAQANHCCYNVPNVQVHGYVFGDRFASGNGRYVGVVQKGGAGGSWSGPDVVYYDPNVLNNVVWAQTPLYRLSWKETNRPW